MSLKCLELKFTSGNSIPVERATVKRSEYDQILLEIEMIRAEARQEGAAEALRDKSDDEARALFQVLSKRFAQE